MAPEFLTGLHAKRLKVRSTIARGLEAEGLESLSNVLRGGVETRAAVAAPGPLVGSEVAKVLFEALSIESGRGGFFARYTGGLNRDNGEKKAEPSSADGCESQAAATPMPFRRCGDRPNDKTVGSPRDSIGRGWRTSKP